jgi:hypothetical protein
MKQKPLVNSLLATLYIALISLIFYLGNSLKIGNQPILAPIAMISLFTLSAAVMGYLFVYQPLVLYLDGKKKLALNFFLKTTLIFALTTLILFLTLFLVKL